MIVDDSPSIRTMVGFVLRQSGYEVHEAVDGREALDWAHAGNVVDLVVTDINMPNVDGLELIRELRSLEAYRYIPILTLTTEGSDEKKMQGKAAGATGWIVKPFDPEGLLKTIAKVL
ncbi:MAG TPA: response regulator [Pseudomonadales bacterium]|nr:response regulator [Pseudomonadales bacterium]